jgi:hypothetical protein
MTVRKIAAYLKDEVQSGEQDKKLKVMDSRMISGWFFGGLNKQYLDSLVCGSCGDEAMQKCSVCGSVRYCSEDCQEAGWEEHSKVCVELVEKRADKARRDDERAEKVLRAFNMTNKRLTFSQFDRLLEKLLHPKLKELVRRSHLEPTVDTSA